MRRAAALAALAALGACGYGFSQRYVARSGAARVGVRTFENRSTEAELGSAVTAALRGELARRGAGGGGGAETFIEGEVSAGEPAPTSAPTSATAGAPASGGTWRISVEVRARLVSGGTPVAEHTARREGHYVAGADDLETEGRRAIALRRLAEEAAGEVLRVFER